MNKSILNNVKTYVWGGVFIGLISVLSIAHADGAYYKTYDEQGRVVFTDVKPNSDKPVETFKPQKNINVIESSGLHVYNQDVLSQSPQYGIKNGQDLDKIYRELGMTPEQYEQLTDEQKNYLKEEGFELPKLEAETENVKIDPKTVYETALKEQKSGKEPRVSDWQRTVKGRRFLKPEYFERQKKLQDKVNQAKQNLN